MVTAFCCHPVLAEDDDNSNDLKASKDAIKTVGASQPISGQPLSGQPEPDASTDTDSRQIGEIQPSLDYAWGDVDKDSVPENFALNTDDVPVTRVIESPLLLQWKASDVWYHPLYFEDPALERYGHTYDKHIQYVLSPVKFIGDAVMLPYKSTLRPHGSREYPLGWYRPGECTPHFKYRPAWNGEAAVNQALAVTGLFFLIP